MQHVVTKIGDLEKSLEKIKQMTQIIQEKPLERQLDLSPAFDDHVRTLVQVQELLEGISDRLQELSK